MKVSGQLSKGLSHECLCLSSFLLPGMWMGSSEKDTELEESRTGLCFPGVHIQLPGWSQVKELRWWGRKI